MANFLYVDNQDYYRQRLQTAYGPQIAVAANFREASEILERDRNLSLIVTEILDAQQRIITIGELIQRARSLNSNSYLPIIGFSNEEAPFFEKRARELGLDAAVLKHDRNLPLLFRYMHELSQDPTKYRDNPQLLKKSAETGPVIGFHVNPRRRSRLLNQ